jgi:hypothetical protein
MQSHLERIGPTFAIMVTSAAFTLLHGTHGLAYLLAVGPGLFLASLVYGYLALRSESIFPGITLHCGVSRSRTSRFWAAIRRSCSHASAHPRAYPLVAPSVHGDGASSYSVNGLLKNYQGGGPQGVGRPLCAVLAKRF